MPSPRPSPGLPGEGDGFKNARQGEAEPGGVGVGSGLNKWEKGIAIDPFPGVGLFVGGGSRAVAAAEEDVVELVFGDLLSPVGLIDEMEKVANLSVESGFFNEAAMCGGSEIFAPARMRAAGVGPQAAEVIFAAAAKLEEHLAVRVDDEDGEGAVEQAGADVGIQLGDGPEGRVVLIDEDDLVSVVADFPLR
jgi:hypothetical protein